MHRLIRLLSTFLFILTTNLSRSSLIRALPNIARPEVASDDFPCPAPEFVMQRLFWYDSAHNIDCGGIGPDVGDGMVCSKDLPCTSGQQKPCSPPDPDSPCVKVNLCNTGVPTLYQNGAPPGYGPVDWISINVSNFPQCNITSLNGLMPYLPISQGMALKCGGTGYQVMFEGDSTKDRADASLTIRTPWSCALPNGTYLSGTAMARAKFVTNCVYDSARNASCFSDPESLTMDLIELPDWVNRDL